MDELAPFALPPDDALFLLRDREKQLKKQKREEVAKLHVWQKTTACTHKGPSHGQRLASVVNKPAVPLEQEDSMAGVPRREKENMTDFVAKKREMFLVQMSLDVKKAEILKLDEKARAKDAALRKSTQMLEEDVARFDTFLQANDAKAHKAMKHAEDMTKKKVDKQQRIKVLKTHISAVMSDIAKHKEQKEEYGKLKRFLDKLTPNEWKDNQKKERVEKMDRQKHEWVEDKLKEINAKIAAELEEEDSRRARAGEAELQGADRDHKKRKLRKKHPPMEQLEKMCPIDEDVDDCPLYFQDQAQVLDIFTALEEQNLFLIQTAQETQQAVEEVEQKFAETKEKMGEKSETLKATIDFLERKIAKEQAQCEQLKKRMHGEGENGDAVEQGATGGTGNATSSQGSQGVVSVLKELGHKVAEVNAVCGFESDHDPDTLQMLANIEAKLEELFAYLDDLENTAEGKDLVLRLEREKERERRDHVRAERVDQQNSKNEERLRKTLQRSQAPVHKKVGKPIMFRSYVANKVKKVVKEDDDAEEAEKQKKLFGIYIPPQNSQQQP